VITGSAIRFGGQAAGRESESGSFKEYRNASPNDDENSKAMKAREKHFSLPAASRQRR
jgi:hypothetical protein